MPTDRVNPADNEASRHSLQTEGPIDERDEVKQAEERTRQLQKEAEGPSQSTIDTDK